MAHQLQPKRILMKGWRGSSVLAVATFLLGLLVGPLLFEKTPSTAPELSRSAVQTESRSTALTPQASSLGTEASPNNSSAPKSSPSKQVALGEKLSAQGHRPPHAKEGADSHGEAARFDQERALFEYPASALYTEAQLSELDPETIRLVEQEIWQGLEASPPAAEEEGIREEMENYLAEVTAAIEEESLLLPPGAVYSEAQLNELDPETIQLFEKEISLAVGSSPGE